MKIKHFAGYGTVTAERIRDNTCKLHVRVSGDHEWGLYRPDVMDLFNWLVRRFDRSVGQFNEWYRDLDDVRVHQGYANGTETCDYYFFY